MASKTIVILGPTGSGKTGVALEIAAKMQQRGKGVEIISADSRAIFRGMDIGTAKPTATEQEKVPHHGIDVVNPDERFTVADWKTLAEQKISEIRGRGNVPIVVGGTGLYIDALVYNYSFSQEAKENYTDRAEMDKDFMLVGVKCEPELLRERLKSRVEKMFDDTQLLAETKKLVQQYDWGLPAMKSNIYEYAWKYLQGEISLERAKELSFYEDWHLAKRQMTWFKRNAEINWLSLEQICDFVLKYI